MKSDWAIVATPVRAVYGRFFRESWPALVGVAVMVVAAAVAEVATPYYFSRLIDTLNADLVTGLGLSFVLYAALMGFAGAVSRMTSYIAWGIAQSLNFIVGTSFFERIVKKRVTFFIEHNPVAIQKARAEGEEALFVFVQLGIIVLLPALLSIGFGVAVLGTVIHPEVVLIVLAYGVVFIGLTYAANRWTAPFLEKAVETDQNNAAFVGNAINAMETLRYFNGDRWIAESFSRKAGQVRTAWGQWSARRMIYAAGVSLALAVQLAVTFLILLPRYEAGQLSVGDIVLINTLMMQLNRPFEMVGSAIDDIVRSFAKLVPFGRMWAEPEEDEVRGGLAIDAGRLEFSGVGVSYDNERIADGVSFVAERGRLTFITGPTGAGKSTLFKLALKALEPGEGSIRVDGTDLATVGRASWYAAIGVVPQEVMLLNDTLAANIVLGRDRDAAKLERATRLASIHRFITGLPEGLETTVGERGLKLSGGERQRIAIARALYDEPAFLFLDEASSALDEATEAAIMAELRTLSAGTTIIAITHRKSVIAETDTVVRLKARKPRGETALQGAAGPAISGT
ncbi:ABC transporter ATP-binding protein [Devosia sp. A16]|uniref:ABC transporter ATP-binding protein n=1 Tax=Devosia sp. A16 TaxID=1736675 RepID=UPI0006D83AFC|nr:ABC transporter ATP-binding protein [Devosia sp. A16]